ncbi:MAG TPA: endopeptidase La [Phycisphaerae bacterium]|nr:endopeptidase La [Phycisphaerae bacterium]
MTSQTHNKPTIIGEDEPEITIQPGLPGEQRRRDHALHIPPEAAVLCVRNMVLFPGTIVPVNIGREKSRRLLEDVLPDQKVIVVVCQKNPEVDEPTAADLYEVGTAAVILKLLRMEHGSQTVIVSGAKRVRIEQWLQEGPYFRARVRELSDVLTHTTETDALVMNARNAAGRIIQLSPNVPEEAAVVLNNIEEPGPLADFLASNVQMELGTKQKLLEELEVNGRLRRVGVELQRQLEVLELSDRIQSQVKANIDKSQREYFLQEQLKAIQKELGQADERTVEIEQVREKLQAAEMPQAVAEEAFRQLDRLSKLPVVSPEYHVIRTYLDWMGELPWSRTTTDQLDVNRAERVLDKDHYDLQKVKRRILEYLSVRKLAPESRGPILCFVGPPGVGKTSLGQSIARALGRKFIRMSLGGMRDEAELRGHRRTYIGAMPGRIVQEIRKVGMRNPVFMLDELDKVGSDFRGDPTAALLEVLDPAQNNSFQDHYLNVPFDLSAVLFIATANYMGTVPPALRDRMEIIELPGYTQQEKLHIATKYLLPRQLKENGLKPTQARWTDPAIVRIIEQHTREAGVRELERQIGTVCRHVASLVATGKARSRKITLRIVAEVLGPARYESEVALRTSTAGVATGLAYTPTGGEIIFIEATSFPGKGRLTLTGQIGDVMRESASAAMSLIKSSAKKLNIDAEQLQQADVHIHVPAGAVPKDGPSAGVAMATALTSLFTGAPVRKEVAMTGEITLRGLVLPIGGVKEKVLAAQRAGIRTVILPERNRKDLADVPEEARKEVSFHFAKTLQDVLDVALDGTGGRKKPRRK